MKITRSFIAKNRRQFRRYGLTGEDMSFLETWVSNPKASLAGIGRMRGYSRQTAHRRAVKLQAIGAVLRVGRRLYFNVQGLLRWCAEGATERAAALSRAQQARRLAAKGLKLLRKSESVTPPVTHRGKDYVPSAENGDAPEAIRAYWSQMMGLP